MALMDYYQCDVCGGKTFYDAHVEYEYPGGSYEGFDIPARKAVGSMKVICPECAESHEVVVRALSGESAP